MSPIIDNFLKLRRKLEGAQLDSSGWLIGNIQIGSHDQSVKTIIVDLEEAGVIQEVNIGTKRIFPPDFETTGTFSLKIDTAKLPGYFENYHALLSQYPTTTPPSSFMVWQENLDIRAGYNEAIKFFLILRLKVEVWDNDLQRFFLVNQNAVEVPLIYSPDDLLSLAPVVPQVIRFLDCAHLDADTRWTLFRNVSAKFLGELPKQSRMGKMLQNLPLLLEKSQQDYSLYLQRFSFEDLLKNFDEKRLKFVTDLNQILYSVQTALIGVPLSFFIIAEKFKPASRPIGINIVILAGGLLFFILLLLLTFNQRSTLQALELAIKDFEMDLENKKTKHFTKIANLLKATWDQFGRVKNFLRLVQILVVLFCVVLIIVFIWCSNATFQKNIPFLP